MGCLKLTVQCCGREGEVWGCLDERVLGLLWRKYRLLKGGADGKIMIMGWKVGEKGCMNLVAVIDFRLAGFMVLEVMYNGRGGTSLHLFCTKGLLQKPLTKFICSTSISKG